MSDFILSNNIVKIYFESSSQDLLILTYQLYQHSLTERWLKLVNDNFSNIKIENDGHFLGKLFCTEEDSVVQISKSIKTINEYSDKFSLKEIFIPLVASAPLTLKFLNEAHEYYEKIEKYKKLKIIPELNSAIVNLNISIHKAEQFIQSNSFSGDHIQLILYPKYSEKLNREDYLLFQKLNKYGEMYLSYGMTGVPTKEAFFNNVTPKPQSEYSNGLMLCFFEEETINDENLKSWAAIHNIDINSEQSAFGLIPLGKLVSPTIENKEQFIKNVSRFKKIFKIEFC